MVEICFEDFLVLVRQREELDNEIDVNKLHDGYLKLQQMISALNRPVDLKTGLAVDFQPEPIR